MEFLQEQRYSLEKDASVNHEVCLLMTQLENCESGYQKFSLACGGMTRQNCQITWLVNYPYIKQESHELLILEFVTRETLAFLVLLVPRFIRPFPSCFLPLRQNESSKKAPRKWSFGKQVDRNTAQCGPFLKRLKLLLFVSVIDQRSHSAVLLLFPPWWSQGN